MSDVLKVFAINVAAAGGLVVGLYLGVKAIEKVDGKSVK